MPGRYKYNEANTLIGVLVSMGILSILSYTIFTLTTSTLQLVSFTRARITARNIASGELEQLRNMPYSDLGTQGGVPAGPLSQTQDIIRNSQAYHVRRTVTYVDDAYDGIAPNDTLATDYKRVRIEVSWEGVTRSGVDPVVLTTNIAPKGIETSEGGGTLSVLVFDANANPVPQAEVSIVSNDQDISVNTTIVTSDTGRISLPGTPACITCYEIVVTKNLYSQDKTYSTSEVANPNKPHVSIIEGDLTEVSFAIDRVSSLAIQSFGPSEANFPPTGNVSFVLQGEKSIGVDVANEPVYKFSNTYTTNASGEVVIENLEWDNYRLNVTETSTDSIAGTNPLLPVSLLPNQNLTLDFTVNQFTSDNLLSAFIDDADLPIASVSAVLYEEDTPIASNSSGIEGSPNFGQVFFSDLEAKTYRLTATSSGYTPFDGNIIIDGQTNEQIILDPVN